MIFKHVVLVLMICTIQCAGALNIVRDTDLKYNRALFDAKYFPSTKLSVSGVDDNAGYFYEKALSDEQVSLAVYSAIAFYHWKMAKTTKRSFAERDVRFVTFSYPRQCDLLIEGTSVSNLEVHGFCFAYHHPLSNNDFTCVMVRFMKEKRFLFALYVNMNEGCCSMDIHTAASRWSLLLALESFFPFLTPHECTIQKEAFHKYADGDPSLRRSFDYKKEYQKIYEASRNLTNDVEVSIDNL